MGILCKIMCLQVLITCHTLKCEPDLINRYPMINNYNININGVDFVKMRDDMMTDLNNYLHNLGKEKSKESLGWFKSHKSKLVLASIATVYLYFMNKITNGKIALYNQTNWANWKQDTGLSELLIKSPNLLYRELNQSILDKYSNNNQTDLITPLLSFNKDIEQELKILRTFSKVGKNLKRFRLKLFFLINDRDLELAADKINRLLYLKNLVNSSIQVSLNN